MRWREIGLWGAFAALLLVGGGQFLFACGFGFAGRSIDYCPVRPDVSALQADMERGRSLQRQIHLAELQLAEKPECKPPTPKPKPTPTPAPTLNHPDVYERGAKRGKYEILLSWLGRDDLDLKVFCPGDGQIGGQGGRPGSCGEGAVDVDANRNLKQNVSDTPEEHAVWAAEVPGEMKVEALLFMVRQPDRPQRLPFEMTFTIDGQSKVCQGVSEWIPKSENRRTRNGARQLATRDAYLMWDPRNGLPASCDWRVDEGYFCNRGECDKP